jgi:outer membrane protein assembly factor BamD (BamD/ComL family)
MHKKRMILLLTISLGIFALAETTWRLQESGWVNVATEPQGQYVLDIAEFKQYVATGQSKKAEKALAQLREKYPNIVGEDMDAFSKGEILYAQRKFLKAFEEYDRFMDAFPQSALNASALERQYEIARAFLYGQKRSLFVFRIHAYEEAAGMIERIVERTGDAPMAKRSMKTLAQSYEDRGEFTEAYYRWSDTWDKWPSGQIGADALLGMADNLHASYRGPKYDASMLNSSRDYYQQYITKYNLRAQEQNIGIIIDEIDEQLADKQLDIAMYYERTSSIVAANLYFRRIVDEWPGSVAAKIAAGKLETKL